MATQIRSGQSSSSSTREAVKESIGEAARGLEDRPSLGFVFAGPQHPLAEVLEEARRIAPATELLACHTAGELTERGLTHGGIAALVVASEASTHEVAVTSGLKADPVRAGKNLTEGFKAALEKATAKGLYASTTVALVDGLAGTGDRLIGEVITGTRPFQQVVGGAAGDEGAFVATHVGAKGWAGPDGAAVAHVFGAHPWGVGVDHGLRATTDKMRVTRAEGNVVYELDGRPAFEAYRDYARSRGVDLQPETAGPFLIGNELGVYFLEHLRHARAPLSVGPEGELSLAAEITEGAKVCILDGEPDSMVAAAGRAAKEAFAALKGRPCAGVLVFDCICRGMILANGFGREIDAIRAVFPGVPIAGFLTYGEIARYTGALKGWHNTTVVVTAIPA